MDKTEQHLDWADWRDWLDSLAYWQLRDRWTAAGREVATLRDEAKRRGVPLESLPGADRRIEEFKRLGRELDRRAR